MTTPHHRSASANATADIPAAAAALVEVHRTDGYPVEGVDDPTHGSSTLTRSPRGSPNSTAASSGTSPSANPNPKTPPPTWAAHPDNRANTSRCSADCSSSRRPAVTPSAAARATATDYAHRRPSTRPRRHDQGHRRHPPLRTPRLAAHRHHPSRRRPRPRHRRLLLRQPRRRHTHVRARATRPVIHQLKPLCHRSVGARRRPKGTGTGHRDQSQTRDRRPRG